jgi:hypothetical protein
VQGTLTVEAMPTEHPGRAINLLRLIVERYAREGWETVGKVHVVPDREAENGNVLYRARVTLECVIADWPKPEGAF